MSVLTQESQCGVGKYRPQWIQFLGTKHWMMFLLCWYCLVQGMVNNGLVPSAISSIERRFKLSTSTMGRIVQFYDFGYVLFCIPVSYFGGRHSKPAVLASGLALMATGSLLFSTPHMLADSYSAGHGNSSLGSCNAKKLGLFDDNSTEAMAESLIAACPIEHQNQPGTFRYVFLFCLAHFLHGIGATPLFTIGVSYIDENVGPALSSLFVGIFYAFAIFGPAAGFLTAGTLLRYHTDFWHLPAEQILRVSGDETDPSWVGAWWLGFIIAAFLGFIAIPFLASLPKVLPESLKWHRTRLREASQSGRRRTPECCGMPGTNKTAALNCDAPEQAALLSNITSRSRGPLWYALWLDVRHIPIAIYRILTNGPFMIITLAMAVDSLVVTGASSFMSKYLERQFSVAPSKANVLIGCIMVPMAGVGCMISGYIVQYFRLSCVKTLKLAIALLFISLMLTPMYLIYCPHDPLIGVDASYPDNEGRVWFGNISIDADPTLNDVCNFHCTCHEAEYHPVCAELTDGRQFSYYSPCHAGCPEAYSSTLKSYNDCTCVPQSTKLRPKRVKKGLCESKCSGLLGFLVLFAPLSFCTFAVGVPIISVILRTVDYQERSFALGIQWIVVRVIGTIPAPVLFGWMFDVSCIRYQSEPCESQSGACLLYSNKLLADLFLTFSIIGQALSMVILICALMLYGGSMQDSPLPDNPNLDTEKKTIEDETKVDEPKPEDTLLPA